jgi:multicomponent K+:H+ antiporter subunit A
VSLFLIAALPFLGAVFPALLIRAGRNASASAAGLTTFLAFVGLLLHAPAVFRGEVIQVGVDWLPGLGLNANFFLDGLGFLFASMILGIGLLIILYARFYLSREDPMGQFYTAVFLFVDWLLEAPARGPSGRADGPGGHRVWWPGDDWWHDDPGQYRRLL